MSDQQPASIDTGGFLEPGKSNLQLIYLLNLAGVVIGITPLISVVLAYLNKGKADGIYESHYTWSIRSFWIAILYALICAVLSVVLIGVLMMLAVAIWWIVRNVVGLQKLGRNEPIANPESWLW